MSADFLVEIGTEELPPKVLRQLMQSFAEGITSRLNCRTATVRRGYHLWRTTPYGAADKRP